MNHASDGSFLASVSTKVDKNKAEIDLWCAVLHRAIKDAKLLMIRLRKDPMLADNHEFRSETNHLHRFFLSKSMQVGGFGFICELLDINTDRALQQVQSRYLRHLPPSHPIRITQPDCQAG